jgi:adenosylcobalamin-dependent ribonucleoside-triphosphate reductase
MEYDGVEFRLTESFLKKFKGKQPKWGPLGYFTFKRTYAREKPNGKTEEFWECLKRVTEGTFLIQKHHCDKMHLPWDNRKAQFSAQEMYNRMWDFKFLPPGRGLFAMGTEFVFTKGGASLNNCGFVSTDQIDTDFSAPFVWVMDMSMLGVGCGFDTKGRDRELFLKQPRVTSDTHVVEDSREGWVTLVKRALDSFVGRDSLPRDVDFSLIRPAGKPIRGFGGIAPGPDPLRQVYEAIISECESYAASEDPVSSTLIVDLMNCIGAAVVAGGIRRTAEIAIGEADDSDFYSLKDPSNPDYKSKPRWASNNSIFATMGMDYENVADLVGANGEPGLVWLDNMRAYGRMGDAPNWADARAQGCNPCGEQTLESFELCNLVETFPVAHDNLDDYKRTLKYAYMYGKTVTLLLTHDPRTNQIMGRNRRIGVSQSGIVENIAQRGLSEHIKWCEEGYKEIEAWDEMYSEWLIIPKSKKRTSIKPSGTVSLLPGRTPGMHFPHSEWYIRRVQVSKQSPLWKAMSDAGYKVEASRSQPMFTMVVEIPVHEPHFWRRKEDVTLWEQFTLASLLQRHWADNQVSCTVTFKESERGDIAHALAAHERTLKSISLLPISDHKYEQAPYETITESRFKKLSEKLSKPKLNVYEPKQHTFCDSDSCELEVS